MFSYSLLYAQKYAQEPGQSKCTVNISGIYRKGSQVESNLTSHSVSKASIASNVSTGKLYFLLSDEQIDICQYLSFPSLWVIHNKCKYNLGNFCQFYFYL